MFFRHSGLCFPVSRGLVNFARRDHGVMFVDVASWSLWLFLNIPLFIGKSFIFKDGEWRVLNNRHSARELKYRNLSLQSHYHNKFFAHCFFFCNGGFLFVLFQTGFLVVKHNTCNGTKNLQALSFLLSSRKYE